MLMCGLAKVKHCLHTGLHAGVSSSSIPGHGTEAVSLSERYERCLYWRSWLIQLDFDDRQLLSGFFSITNS